MLVINYGRTRCSIGIVTRKGMTPGTTLNMDFKAQCGELGYYLRDDGYSVLTGPGLTRNKDSHERHPRAFQTSMPLRTARLEPKCHVTRDSLPNIYPRLVDVGLAFTQQSAEITVKNIGNFAPTGRTDTVDRKAGTLSLLHRDALGDDRLH